MIMHHIVHCIDCVFLLCCRYLSPLSRHGFYDVINDTDEELYHLQKCQASKTPLFILIQPTLSLLLSFTALGQQ